MNRDKQDNYYELERLLRVRKLDIEKQGCDLYSLLHKTENEEQSLARYLIDCGYCKASDLAEEIFAAIEEMVITEKSNDGCALYLDKVELAELKKKYTEVQKRNVRERQIYLQ